MITKFPNIIRSENFLKFKKNIEKDMIMLLSKLNSDIQTLEFICDEVKDFKVIPEQFHIPGDLLPFRRLFNRTLVGINEFNFSINANFYDSKNRFITPYHLIIYNDLLPSGFLSFDYFNSIMRYIILININYHC
jgi:hypothetical protein